MTHCLNISIDDAMQEQLLALSQSRDCSPADLAREALAQYMEIQSWQIQAIRDGVQAANEGRVVSDNALRSRWQQKLGRRLD